MLHSFQRKKKRKILWNLIFIEIDFSKKKKKEFQSIFNKRYFALVLFL
jgi:hypothetical protein